MSLANTALVCSNDNSASSPTHSDRCRCRRHRVNGWSRSIRGVGPAANAAGTWLLLSLVIAGGVALCNATSSAQLAARHPESGGTYVYARERLSPFWGHVAGWGFIVGKTASCAAMGLTAGLYIWPSQARLVATAAVVLIAAINLGGLSRTAFVTRVVLGATCLTLIIVVTSAWVQTTTRPVEQLSAIGANAYGVLQAAGLIFFAFAGYARIATFGEEVINPERTIPWAIQEHSEPFSLSISRSQSSCVHR